ncbi:carrier superfamily protein [Besnoitia besnoiti]|uniref:Carrier superfamily protein n=1 Tax=Besnoitia besnoiti TaxID=94643 RepID=A0A2A9M7S4_BESBE|nr:carrier superfamily protein [Besnoitia besnoiti]PFH31412.1 carrier superfamily protein [Besnoitia besnoiti]
MAAPTPAAEEGPVRAGGFLEANLEWEEWRGDWPLALHAAAGSVAGLMEHLTMYPIDTIKTRVQALCIASTPSAAPANGAETGDVVRAREACRGGTGAQAPFSPHAETAGGGPAVRTGRGGGAPPQGHGLEAVRVSAARGLDAAGSLRAAAAPEGQLPQPRARKSPFCATCPLHERPLPPCPVAPATYTRQSPFSSLVVSPRDKPFSSVRHRDVAVCRMRQTRAADVTSQTLTRAPLDCGNLALSSRHVACQLPLRAPATGGGQSSTYSSLASPSGSPLAHSSASSSSAPRRAQGGGGRARGGRSLRGLEGVSQQAGGRAAAGRPAGTSALALVSRPAAHRPLTPFCSSLGRLGPSPVSIHASRRPFAQVCSPGRSLGSSSGLPSVCRLVGCAGQPGQRHPVPLSSASPFASASSVALSARGRLAPSLYAAATCAECQLRLAGEPWLLPQGPRSTEVGTRYVTTLAGSGELGASCGEPAGSQKAAGGRVSATFFVRGEEGVKAERGRSSVFSAARSLYREGGIPRFYRGATAVASGCVPAHALYFLCYEGTKEFFLDRKERSLSPSASASQSPSPASGDRRTEGTEAGDGDAASLGNAAEAPGCPRRAKGQRSNRWGPVPVEPPGAGWSDGWVAVGEAQVPGRSRPGGDAAEGAVAGEERLQLSPVESLICGGLATVTHDIVLTPMDVIKQRLQLGCYRSPLDCLRTVLQQEGVAALCRSLPATVLLNLPYGATLVCVNEWMKQTVFRRFEGYASGSTNLYLYFLCAAVSGGVAGLISNPLDVIKTRLQTQDCYLQRQEALARQATARAAGLGKGPGGLGPGATNLGSPPGAFLPRVSQKYTSLHNAVRTIFREEGVRGFWKGTSTRIALSAPATGICWGSYETVKYLWRRLYVKETGA